jgi:glycosyltransferase involved in cell wall biosynthesis
MDNWLNIDTFKAQFQKVNVEEFNNDVENTVPDPKLTVILVTYNHIKYISKAIDSILMQKTIHPFEIIIGDDDSSDGTREICIEYAKKHPDKIRLFLHKRENNIKVLGKPCLIFQFAYNLLHCRGEYIAVLSGDDCWMDKNKIKKQLEFLEKNKNYSRCTHHSAKVFTEQIESDRKEKIIAKTHPSSLMLRNYFDKVPRYLLNVLQEDAFIQFILSTKGDLKILENIKPNKVIIHKSNTWNNEKDKFQLRSKLNTCKYIYKTYVGSIYEEKAANLFLVHFHNYVKDHYRYEFNYSIFVMALREGLLFRYSFFLLKRKLQKIFRFAKICLTLAI